jgi:hypothetical protein
VAPVLPDRKDPYQRRWGKVRLEELICDGVMVATPAGSTAYNLSAHGPILPLDAPLLALTPVSPFRPRRWRGALISNHSTVRLEVLEDAPSGRSTRPPTTRRGEGRQSASTVREAPDMPRRPCSSTPVTRGTSAFWRSSSATERFADTFARRDVLGIAQTGTGKTAAFVLPMIDAAGKGPRPARMPRTLILEPTRELAAQVEENFDKYGKNHKLNVALLIGGVSFDDQDAKKLDRGVDVLIATPGRLLDHFERGKLLLTGVEILVIDEADRMLDMGFIPDIERICKLLPPPARRCSSRPPCRRRSQRSPTSSCTTRSSVEVAKPPRPPRPSPALVASGPRIGTSARRCAA